MSVTPQDTREKILIWTDGSSNREKQDGGMAFASTFQDRRMERWQGYGPSTTNNQMEIGAILLALSCLQATAFPVIIYSDSKYTINCLTMWHQRWARNGWKKADGGPVQNKELIQATLSRLMAFRRFANVTFEWVKGHSGNVENERVDFLASASRRQMISNVAHPLALDKGITGSPALYSPDKEPINDFQKAPKQADKELLRRKRRFDHE